MGFSTSDTILGLCLFSLMPSKVNRCSSLTSPQLLFSLCSVLCARIPSYLGQTLNAEDSSMGDRVGSGLESSL